MIQYQIEAGGEYLLGFAKRKLDDVKKQREALDVIFGQRWYVFTTGETVHVISVGTLDIIRITVTSGSWNFYIVDRTNLGANNQENIFLVTVDTATFTKVNLGSGVQLSGANKNVKTGVNCMALFYDSTAGWEWVDNTGKLNAFQPTEVGQSFNSVVLSTVFEAAEDKKIAALLNYSISGTMVMGDGSTFVDTLSTAGVGAQNTVYATKDDVFYYSNVSNKVLLISLANGTLLSGTVGTDFHATIPTVICPNYTDLFFAVFDSTPAKFLLYRDGFLDFTSANTATLHCGLIGATPSAIHSYAPNGPFQTSSFSGPINLSFSMVRGVLTGAVYVYTETLVSVTNDFLDATLSITAVAVTATIGYLFMMIQRSSDSKLECRVVGTDGSLVAVTALDSPQNNHVSFASPIATSGPISFKTICCAVGLRENSSAKMRVVFFAFSDGTYVDATLPFTTPDITITKTVGSASVAYAYVNDTTNTSNFLVGSDGTNLTLSNPTLAGDTISSLSVIGFVEQQAGCRLMFSVVWVSGLNTYHHWDEGGSIFNYGTPTFVNASGRQLVIPTPSAIHRMSLLDTWG